LRRKKGSLSAGGKGAANILGNIVRSYLGLDIRICLEKIQEEIRGVKPGEEQILGWR
jgi:hypothetical protein